ncbi:hypothetical protein ACLOJK_027856 [Asimina triloba]
MHSSVKKKKKKRAKDGVGTNRRGWLLNEVEKWGCEVGWPGESRGGHEGEEQNRESRRGGCDDRWKEGRIGHPWRKEVKNQLSFAYV